MQRGLLSRHRPDDLVAFGAGGSRTARDLLRDAAAVSARLPDGAQGREVVLVIRKDRYALAVAILATWTRGYVPCLPPELDRDAITMLAEGRETATVLHDTASGIPLRIDLLLQEAEQFADASLTVEVLATLSGEARTYGRSAARLLAPQSWGDAWSAQAHAISAQIAIEPGLRWATSVNSEHPHGIVFGVLWPLLTGGAFLRETLAPRALGAQLGAQAIDVLVSVPAHLSELLAGGTHAKAELTHVFSALEPVPASLAEATRRALGAELQDLAPLAEQISILRCRESQDSPAHEGALAQRCERLLRAQPGVRDVAVVEVTGAAEPLLCAAVVGDALDMDSLRVALAKEVGSRTRLELALLNRIRRDGIGRAQPVELLRQFGLRADGSAVTLALLWGESTTREDGDNLEQRTRVHIPADYGYFDGHFSSYPILAGAAQLGELVLPCVRQAQPALKRLTSMARLKFTGRIQPGDTIDVVLTMRRGATTVDFALKRGDTLCSAGALSFAEPNATNQAAEEGR